MNMPEFSKEFVTSFFPVDDQPPIKTLDKPVIIECACPGFQKGGERYPAIPISIDDQINEISESVEAGATLVHIHPRDPKTGDGSMDNKLLKTIVDGIFDRCGDIVTITMGWDHWETNGRPVDYISKTAALLELGGGNKYIQANLMIPLNWCAPGGDTGSSWTNKEVTAAGARFMCENGVKTIYQCYDTYSHLGIKMACFDTGADTQIPRILNVQAGKHDSLAVGVDPWSYINLISMMELHRTIPNSVVGVYPGGRNWLPMMIMGIIGGCEIIRAGVEDAYWMYPHRNEVIKKNSDLIKLAYNIATMVGRRVITDPKEARAYLGIERKGF
jgi:3-keto-5-aminohexanoate cleavage enzyme